MDVGHTRARDVLWRISVECWWGNNAGVMVWRRWSTGISLLKVYSKVEIIVNYSGYLLYIKFGGVGAPLHISSYVAGIVHSHR